MSPRVFFFARECTHAFMVCCTSLCYNLQAKERARTHNVPCDCHTQSIDKCTTSTSPQRIRSSISCTPSGTPRDSPWYTKIVPGCTHAPSCAIVGNAGNLQVAMVMKEKRHTIGVRTIVLHCASLCPYSDSLRFTTVTVKALRVIDSLSCINSVRKSRRAPFA